MLEVQRAGLSVVQDAGRFGFAEFGIAASGFADAPSARLCNAILNKPETAACIEVHQSVFALRAHAAVALCVFGAFVDVQITRKHASAQSVACGQAISLRSGDQLHINRWHAGRTIYIATDPGLDIPPILQSQSTDVPNQFGGYGGRFLRRGDQLLLHTDIARQALEIQQPSAFAMPLWTRCANPARLRFIAFDEALSQALRLYTYTVRADSSRAAMRLGGENLPVTQDASLAVSAGVVPGCIQVLPSGEPLVLGVDAQTLGGYPLAGCVIDADLPLLAQLPVGATLAFCEVDLSQAELASHDMQRLFSHQLAQFTKA